MVVKPNRLRSKNQRNVSNEIVSDHMIIAQTQDITSCEHLITNDEEVPGRIKIDDLYDDNSTLAPQGRDLSSGLTNDHSPRIVKFQDETYKNTPINSNKLNDMTTAREGYGQSRNHANNNQGYGQSLTSSGIKADDSIIS